MMKLEIPKIKKKISMFLQSEEGKITKEQAVVVATSLLLTTKAMAKSNKKYSSKRIAKNELKGNKVSTKNIVVDDSLIAMLSHHHNMLPQLHNEHYGEHS